MSLRIVDGKVQNNQSAPISEFANGEFPPCTCLHCNVTGEYRVYVDTNQPSNYVSVNLLQGILYMFPCWKVMSSDGSLLSGSEIVVCWIKY